MSAPDDQDQTAGVARLNARSEEAAREGLLRTCGSSRWVTAMIAERPFRDAAHLFSAASRHWKDSTRADLLEAFAHHPRIGDAASAKTPNDARGAAWAAKEQAGAASGSDETKQRLAEGNRAYEARFGHVYLVCATGKSAEEMLALLTARLRNGATEELAIAAGEQEKIAHIRLERWLSE